MTSKESCTNQLLLTQSDSSCLDLSFEVYGALYDFVERQAAACHMEMVLPKKAFLLNTRQHPNCVDTSIFADLDDKTCIQAMFWSLLNRVPDQQTMAIWMESTAAVSARRFRKSLFQRLSHSMEARTKRVRSVPGPFAGLDRIDCFEGTSQGMNVFEHFWFFLSFYVFDKITLFLYRIYQKTLRPTRIRIRDKRRASKALRKKTGDHL